jgi:hypothetical protein
MRENRVLAILTWGLAMTRFFFIALFFLTASAALADEVRVSWEVIQPFRLLKYQSDQKIHEWAMAEVLRDNPGDTSELVSKMEQKLNNPHWWDNKPPGGDKSYRQLLEQLRFEEKRDLSREIVKFDPRLGWASMLRNSELALISSGTCWNANSKDYNGCVSDIGSIKGKDEFAFPKVHVVTVKGEHLVAGKWLPYDGRCTFRLSGLVNAGFGFIDGKLSHGREFTEMTKADCSQGAVLRVEYPKTYQVEMSTDDAMSTETIGVTDLLVAGIGDSFAAGEGNPELPAKLDAKEGLRPHTGVVANTHTNEEPGVLIPVREIRRHNFGFTFAADTYANWFDQQCHRSVYGPQFRAAMAIALYGKRHHAVTFISYSCSGAEITDGIFWPQDHRECGSAKDAKDRMHQPQLSGLVRTLSGSNAVRRFPIALSAHDRWPADYTERSGKCASWRQLGPDTRNPSLVTGQLRRKIDLLMVGVGGNDIGFSPMVSKIVVNSGFLALSFPVATDAAVHFYQQAAGAITLAKVSARLTTLNERYKALSIAIRKKLEIDDPQRVLITEYPGFARDEKKHFCAGGNTGMNISKLLSVLPKRSNASDVLPEDGDAIRIRLNSKLRQFAHDNGWRYVPLPSNVNGDVFMAHGFCAVGQPVVPTAEILDVPHGLNGWQKFGNTRYNPASDFYPYASRQRWVRTFNDAYMLAFHFKEMPMDTMYQQGRFASYFASRSLGGPMHPTAEGYAHVADGIYSTAIPVLFDTTTGGVPKN